MTTLQPFQQRVVDEKAELDSRLSKLEQFFLGEIYVALDDAEQFRLHIQSQAMKMYADILEDRIAAFGGLEEARYQALEREHLGDPDKKTGIYHPDNSRPAAPAVAQEDAYRYACSLAETIRWKHYPDVPPPFTLMPTVCGVLTQIDNMVSGLARASSERDALELRALRAAMRPRFWTRDLSDAWHSAIPDVYKAFDDLKEAAMQRAAKEKVFGGDRWTDEQMKKIAPRQWVDLTEGEKLDLARRISSWPAAIVLGIVDAVAKKLKEKNGYAAPARDGCGGNCQCSKDKPEAQG